jgi:hypothetical protein
MIKKSRRTQGTIITEGSIIVNSRAANKCGEPHEPDNPATEEAEQADYV